MHSSFSIALLASACARFSPVTILPGSVSRRSLRTPAPGAVSQRAIAKHLTEICRFSAAPHVFFLEGFGFVESETKISEVERLARRSAYDQNHSFTTEHRVPPRYVDLGLRKRKQSRSRCPTRSPNLSLTSSSTKQCPGDPTLVIRPSRPSQSGRPVQLVPRRLSENRGCKPASPRTG